MKFNRIISFIICVLMLTGCAFTLIGCGDEGGNGASGKCEHEWSEWSYLKAPTCEKEGEETRTCIKCTGIQIRKAEKISHDYKLVGWTWDSNKENAFIHFRCSYNKTHNKVEKGEITSSVKVAPTCGKSGINILTATYVFNEVTYTDTVEVTVPATNNHTFANGVCTVCGNHQ